MSPSTPIHTTEAPEAIGAYSQAVRTGTTVYLSGQIALDPATMQLVSDEIEGQAQQVFRNLDAVCRAAGGSLAQVVKLQLYLVDLGHFQLVNEVMSRFFAPPYPARAAIGVAALPRGALIEIDAIMELEDGGKLTT